MSIKNSYPNLKPSLLLDFANTKKLDPRITFTRTTTATYYDGKTVAKAEENLLIESEQFDTWTATASITVTANANTAPNGTSTADAITFNGADRELRKSITAPNGTYTFSVYIKGTAGETVAFGMGATTGTTNQSITLDGTWQRATYTTTVTSLNRVWVGNYGATATNIQLWGAQLEQRSSVTAYTPTTTQPVTNYVPVLQTAAAGQARFDHNPVTGESLGLLIEEQRSNLLTYSDDFANAAWGKLRSSVSSNTIIAPDGTLTGDKFVEDTTANNTHYIFQNFTGTAVNYTFSMYAKAGERNWLALRVYNGTAYTALAFFNLSTGAIGTITSGTASIQPVGNGWYKCSVSGLMAATTCNVAPAIANADNSVSYTGDGYSGIYIWGAQLEAGAFPTSYIATTGSTATRNADAASMTGTNFSSWYRQDSGSVYGETRTVQDAAVYLLSISDNTANNRMQFLNWSTRQGQIVVSNVDQALLDNGTVSTTSFIKLAMRYEVNNAALSLSGAAVATDTSCLIPVVDRMYIGASHTGTVGGQIYLKKLAYYPASLTNDQLAAIATS